MSASTTITVGAAAQLHFSTQPSGGVSNAPFATQPVVSVEVAGGNAVTTDTSAVTLALTTPAGATLACTGNPKAAVAGIATFAGCNVNLVGTYTLTATDGALTAATSAPLTVTAGPAVALAMVTAPTGGATGADWTVQPVLRFVDAFGNTATSSTDLVTIEIVFGPSDVNGVECGANPQAAVSGVVAFAHCTINTAHAPPSTWSLQFTSVFGSVTAPVTEH